MNPDACDNDADLWLNLRDRIRKGLDDATALLGSYPCPVELNCPRDEAERRWFATCIRVQQPVNDSVNHWLRTGVVEERHEPYRWFLRQRFLCALRLVRQFAFSRHHTTDPEWICIFPFPDSSPDDVLAFLLRDWWLGAGVHVAFEMIYDFSQQNLIDKPEPPRQ